MRHLVAWPPPGRLLFRTWVEGLALWSSLVEAFPDLDALVVMPHHVHVDGDWDDDEHRLCRATSGYARFRNHHRGGASSGGPVFARHPAPSAVVDEDHARRMRRYIHLNPCRDHLVSCPLAWPLSTHRDRTGLAAFPVVERSREPERFHGYVSIDAERNPRGTPFPLPARNRWTMAAVLAGVSAVARCPPAQLRQRGPARTLAIETAWASGIHDADTIATAVGISASSVRKVVSGVPTDPFSRELSPAQRAALAVLGDERFAGLEDGDLLHTPFFAPLRHRR